MKVAVFKKKQLQNIRILLIRELQVFTNTIQDNDQKWIIKHENNNVYTIQH